MAVDPCFGILIIGDEILSGRRKDKHLGKAIDILGQHNLELSWARYAGDDESLLIQHFREIKNLGHSCFSFGGIGATVDDRTRQAVARAFDQGLVRHPDAVKEIEAQFGDRAYPNRILMADLPGGAEIIPNPRNRVPGFTVGAIHCLPGFPEMAWSMMEWVLDTKYQHIAKPALAQKTLLLHNVHESDLIELLANFQSEHSNIKLSSLPSLKGDGDSQIELGVKGTVSEVDKAMEALKEILHARGLMRTD